MIKKVALFTVLLVVLGFSAVFAAPISQIDGLTPGIPTQVFVNPGGLGDALVYGYYNVRNNDVFFTVTNTDTTNGARVRIRFREAATIDSVCNGSQETLDFDICLSAGDVWTGQLTSDTATGAARLLGLDTDTFIQAVPATVGNPNPAVIFPTAFPFGQLLKFGSANVLTAVTADMTREGYFEVIAERPLTEVCGGTTGIPCTCGNLRDQEREDVGNTLMGHAYIVNVAAGASFGYAATALSDFAHGDIFDALTSPHPTLADGDDGLTGVNYVLTKNKVFTVYDLETELGAKTALVVTFPTKILTHDGDFVSATGECTAGESDIFDDTRVLLTVFDDKENEVTPSNCEFSPCPEGQSATLDHEVNLLNMGGASTIFTSDVETTVDTKTFTRGWISVDFTSAADATSTAINPPHQTSRIFDGDLYTSHGWPAIGYVIHTFANGGLTGMIPLQYSADVTAVSLVPMAQ